MKKHGDWWLPSHEQHLQAWMLHPKNRGVVINGRVAYQGRKQQAVLDACKKRRVAIDVGAHCGLWSFNLAHEFEVVHAFEPVAVHRECFERNVTAKNVVLHPLALGAEPGMVKLESEHGSSGNTRVVGAGDIELRPLDSFALADVDLIKIDTEGFEENVLRGAVDTLQRCHPVVIVEQKRDMAEQMGLPKLGAVHFLASLGYRVAKEISGDYLMVTA